MRYYGNTQGNQMSCWGVPIRNCFYIWSLLNLVTLYVDIMPSLIMDKKCCRWHLSYPESIKVYMTQVFCNILTLFKNLDLFVKVYKAISDSLENCKTLKCIGISFILNFVICIIKCWMCSLYNYVKTTKPKNILLYNVLFW